MSWCTKSSLWWTTSNCDEEGRKRNGRMRRESVWPCWKLEHFLPPLTQATAGWSRRPFSPDEGPGNGAAVGARPRSVYIALHVECPWYLFGHVDLSACLWVWSHCERILEFPQSYRVCVRAWNTHTHTHIITTRFSKVALFSSTLRQNMLDGCQESWGSQCLCLSMQCHLWPLECRMYTQQKT